MRSSSLISQIILLLSASYLTLAASSWGFTDASLAVSGKGGVGSGFKEKLDERKSFSQPVSLKSSDTLKVILTTQEGNTPRRPHQAFLLLREEDTGLDTSYAFSVKETGKAKVELSPADLPVQFLKSSQPLTANIVIGSFGSSKAYNDRAFTLNLEMDAAVPATSSTPLRYGKLPEIHHVFRPDPKNPPKIITLFFTAAVLVTMPALLGTWLYLGGNINHLSNALSSAPVSHLVFFGSILTIEGIFFLYYSTWNLFQTLPVGLAVGAIAFLSGSRALSEVQERRLAGLR